jgi:hypothetical protein
VRAGVVGLLLACVLPILAGCGQPLPVTQSPNSLPPGAAPNQALPSLEGAGQTRVGPL